jgi:hypothetical protein
MFGLKHLLFPNTRRIIAASSPFSFISISSSKCLLPLRVGESGNLAILFSVSVHPFISIQILLLYASSTR